MPFRPPKGSKALLAEQRQRLPRGVDFTISLDTTRAVTEGIKEIVETLLIAIVLVILVVYVFLQSWRATLIPLLAVPVSLIGTFVVFPLFGFSINTLSLFGLVLAIGLVVDDAIVVVEAVEHHIEEGMSPKDATFKAMEEISAPVVGIALVLSAVFIPTAFIPGITGRLYQQFAVTIAISVLLSAFNALTLSPALSALLLRPRTRSRGVLQRFFGWFNRVFARATEGYVHGAAALIRKVRDRIRPAACVRRPCGLFRQPAAFELSPGRGPGLHVPQSSAPQRRIAAANGSGRPRDRGPAGEDARRRIDGQRHRLQPAEPDQIDLQRVFLRHVEGMEGPAKARGAVPVHPQQREPEARRPPARHCVLVFSAGHSRRRNLRRVHVRSPGSLGK